MINAMAKVQIQADCGNAPRKLFLKNLNIAFANGDSDYLTDILPESINWIIVGQKNITGREKYLKELKRHKLWKVKELIIHTIITHGPDAGVCGQIVTPDSLKYSFCDIYKFKGAGGTRIKSITTFIIEQ
jgi:hypothetical protein